MTFLVGHFSGKPCISSLVVNTFALFYSLRTVDEPRSKIILNIYIKND